MSPQEDILKQAMDHHRAGRLRDAETLYRQILTADPHHADALFNWGILAHEAGRIEIAAQLFSKAVSSRPDFVEAHFNLGNTLYVLDRLDEAAAEYRRAATLKPDYTEAHYNLGVVLQDLSELAEAAASYRRAVALKPDYAEAHLNLGTIFYNQGKLDEAVQSMQTALEKAPENSEISYSYINLLNNYMPDDDMGSPYIRAQRALQQVGKGDVASTGIADETVRRLYRQCSDILALHNLELSINRNQLFRGVINKDNCPRHLMVFNTYNVIPEYCFGCFKVTIEPRTVMELFKLLLVFDRLRLPGDNPRKCIVEVRPAIPGTYKGFIYCKSLKEGQDILHTVQPVLDDAISSGIAIYVKRGCSEFQVAYPEYGHLADNSIKQSLYSAEWRRIEAEADKKTSMLPFEKPANFTNNHEGFTLLDILVMRNWLTYAAKIGDPSYRKIVE